MVKDSIMRMVPEPASMGDTQGLSKMVYVTPTIAEEILKYQNDRNRKLNEVKVKKYIADMLAGNWRGDNGESIKFDTKHKLIDGQHRLMALCRAGISLDMEFRTGLDPDTRVTIDTGKPRSGGDVLAMTFDFSGEDSHAVSRALSLLSQYDAGESLCLGGRNSLTTTSVQEQYLDRSTEVDAALEFTKTELPKKRERVLSHSDHIFLSIIFREAGGVTGETFLLQVLGGAFIIPGSNEQLLRSYLVARALAKKKPPVHIALHTIIRAWNYSALERVYSSIGSMTFVPGSKPQRATKR